MPIRKNKAVVAVKAETSDYTEIAVAAADAFPAFDIEISPDGAPYEQQELREFFGKKDLVAGPVFGEIAFKLALVGSGTAGTAPHFGEALKAAGMSETVVAVTSVTYKPVSTFDGTGDNPDLSYTVAVYEDGLKYALKGCLGTVKFVCEMGKPIIAEFSFMGSWVTPTDATLLSPTGVSSEVAPSFLNAGLGVIGSYTPIFEKIEYDIAQQLSQIGDANDAAGVLGYTITDRQPVGSFDPDHVLVATNPFFTQWQNATTGAMSTGQIGSAGNQIQITCARAQYTGLSMDDKDGRRTLGADFRISVAEGGSDGDDLSLIFT